jgi:hypothetical protein
MACNIPGVIFSIISTSAYMDSKILRYCESPESCCLARADACGGGSVCSDQPFLYLTTTSKHQGRRTNVKDDSLSRARWFYPQDW